MKAKKSLGQHFLKSEKALSQIIDASDPTGSDIILEIGPGHGVLTERLVSFAGKVLAIEKDRELIPLLEERFAAAIENKKLEILHKDILDFDPEVLSFYKGHSYKLVANIPYYITGAIIEKFLSTPYQPSRMVLLMQKEVAERIIARDKKESILSIAVKAYGIPKIVGKVPPGAFVPPPTVDSAVLLIENISRDFFIDPQTKEVLCDETLFFKVVKGVFGKKRKQIGGSLSEILGNKDHALNALRGADIDPKTRPEDLSLIHWKILTTALGRIQQ
ncbi:MAG TPA: 16S rRNA (adenine(1518)-N(6)/adenine(1519)-N(6))-dimethyltransferase RsmA [Candidatus Paceibacterota bacterium]